MIQEKTRVVREMVLKYLAIENLIERNKAAEEEAEEKGDDQEEEETASEENSCTTTIKELGVKTPSNLKKSSAIHFPFLVVKGSSTPSVVILTIEILPKK